MLDNRGRAALIVLILLAGIAVAVSNALVYTDALQYLVTPRPAASFADALAHAYARRPWHMILFLSVPVGIAVMVALSAALTRGEPERATTDATQPALPEEAPTAGADEALRLLAALQGEGRLIDFLEEDISAYEDAEVGGAVRAVHEGCRKALHARLTIERIVSDPEGSPIQIESGFDPARFRLTGNVQGDPPFRGTLQHAGWKVSEVRLSDVPSDLDATILAPAEVEVS